MRMSRGLVLLILSWALLGACGDDDSFADAVSLDATRIDASAGIDASLDAAPATVTIHVQQDGAAAEGVAVLFHDASGALIIRVATNASGDATANVPAGSMATAVLLNKGFTSLRSVVGLVPGDVVELGNYRTDRGELGSQTFNVPFVEASAYLVCVPCSCSRIGSGATGAVVDLLEGCTTATLADVVAATLDEIGLPDAFFVQADVAVGGGDPVTLEGTYQPSSPVTFDLGIVDGTQAEVQTTVTSMHDGAPWISAHRSFDDISDGPLTIDTVVTTTEDGVALILEVLDDDGGSRVDVARLAAAPRTYEVDLATDLLPAVTNLEASATGLTWQVGEGGVTADGVAAGFGYNSDGSVYWSAILPPGSTSFTLPTLPEDLAGLWAPPDGTFVFEGEVDLLESDQVAGYDALRGGGEAGLDLLYDAQREPPAAVSRIRLSTGLLQGIISPGLQRRPGT